MAGVVTSRFIGLPDREAALDYLSRDSVANLFLLDLTARLGRSPEPGEGPTEIVGAWCNDDIIGMAGLRPSVVQRGRPGRSWKPYPKILATFGSRWSLGVRTMFFGVHNQQQ